MRWLIFALCSALLFIYGLAIDSTELRLLTKGLPVLALIFWLRSAPEGPYRRWISLGLLFSLAGDILLDWPADLFVFGLGAFLIGHLCYLVAYLGDSRRIAPLALVPALAAGGGMFAILASQPLESRYGFHVVWVDQRIEGQLLPYEAVEGSIRAELNQRVWQVAVAQYLKGLVGEADIQGIILDGAESPLVQ